MRFIRGLLACMVGIFAGGLMLALPAAATEGDDHYGTGIWQLREATAGWADSLTGDSWANCDAAFLDRPAENVGVSYEATDLDLEAEEGDVLTVDYEASDEANTGAGAVRMFAYSYADADTWNVGPDVGVAIANAKTGTLTIDLPAGKIGSFGLVYDASNATTGWVKFNHLRVGDKKIKMCKPHPTEPPSPSPGTSTVTPAALEELALTGGETGKIAAAGGVIVLLGAGVLVLLYVTRRRDERHQE